MSIVFRPLTDWPGQLRTDDGRAFSRFKASWTDTTGLLTREAEHLGADRIVLQIAIPDSQIRGDGWPYARAKASHPGVTVVLPDSDQGRVSFSTDRYRESSGYGGYLTGWRANVRAIALTMEALRTADRHGVMQGRQYAGFREIGAGTPMPSGQMTVEDAARFIAEQSDYPEGSGLVPAAYESLIHDVKRRQVAYRVAAKRLHPDADGDAALFQRLQQAKAILDEAAAA